MGKYYIASCVFSTQFPKLSLIIQNYVRDRLNLTSVRCCIPKYKLNEFTEKMPVGKLREQWLLLPDSAIFKDGDDVYSLCHNCNNIIEEMRPNVRVHSLWELLDTDNNFPFPNYHGMKVTVQDCWRSRNRREEQDAVRSLLVKMNIEYVETNDNHANTEFCGVSLYRPQPPRNPKLAPKHYVDDAAGKFVPHTLEEQKQIMECYCSQYTTEKVICYCHYCLEGLKMANIDGHHIAELLFAKQEELMP